MANAETAQPAAGALPGPAADKSAVQKVVVLFKATGDAPILKQQKFKITGSDRFAKVVTFLRGQLQRETVFVYLRSSFTPSFEDTVIDLFETFGEDGKLVVFYALTPAWG